MDSEENPFASYFIFEEKLFKNSKSILTLTLENVTFENLSSGETYKIPVASLIGITLDKNAINSVKLEYAQNDSTEVINFSCKKCSSLLTDIFFAMVSI